MPIELKICGINSENIIKTIIKNGGCKYLGFVFYPPSPRNLAIEYSKKLTSIVPDHIPGSLAYDFWSMVNAYEAVQSELRRTRIRLDKTRARAEEEGMEAVLTHWVLTNRQPHITERLIAYNMMDLTADAVLIRHKSNFPAKARRAATERIEAL